MSTYKDVVAYLFNQYPSYQKKGKDAYKGDLSNIKSLCELIGNPQKDIKTIHVAGTNGKGSVCNILYNIFKKSGYKVGIFTSPHLIDFRERIEVDDDWITKDYVVNFYEKNLELFSDVKPSFFEWSTALAFSFFKDSNTDINIIETGLGGRLDSTNIINPDLSIITSIGIDHESILGNTLDKIAFEKAGIIKESTPTLLGSGISSENVFSKICKERNAPLYKAEENQEFLKGSLPNYQIKNWNTAKKAVEILKTNYSLLNINDEPSSYITIKGRWQVVFKSPRIILDIGHNKQCIEELKKQLENEKFNKLHLIIGISNDKNLEAIISTLPNANLFYLTKSDNSRSVDPELIKQQIKINNSVVFQDYKAAFLKSKENANEDDLILVTGSAFLIGNILKEFY